MTRLLAILSALLALAATARAQTTITLRPSAAVAPGSTVLLGQISEIRGPEANSLASVEVLSRAHPQTLSIEEVRRTLNAAKVNWGQLTLTGNSCVLSVADPAAATAPASHTTQPPAPAQATDPGTVRAALSVRIAQILRAEPADLRLAFYDADSEILNLPVTQRTLEVKSTGFSDRLSLALTLYDQDHIAASKTIRVGVQVRRNVLVAAAAKRRGDILSDADFTAQSQWLGPASTPATREQALGSALKSRLAPGEIITEAHLAAPVIVNKGDQVIVRCLAGSVVVTTRARALADARDGEIVQLQAIDSPGRTFAARMDGRGRAVLVSTTTKSRRESP
jgi:flagella basal body P-ring formation protein FlgA